MLVGYEYTTENLVKKYACMHTQRMPRRAQSPARIKALRQMIGLSQAKFAELIGANIDTLKSAENGRLPISPELALRIQGATGAMLAPSRKGRPIDFTGKGVFGQPYSAATFDMWRNSAPTPEARAEHFAAACKAAFMKASARGTEKLLVFLVSAAIESAGENAVHDLRSYLSNSLPAAVAPGDLIDLGVAASSFDVRNPKPYAPLS